ncbi:MAG: hypothetical protein RIM99_18730 [Cyclobacteriaceae bacterium]
MIRSGIRQLLNAFRIFFIILLMTTLFANTILTLMDQNSPDNLELTENSETETEKETEKETEQTDTDELINGLPGTSLQSQNILAIIGENIHYRINTHGKVTTPPPEQA